MALATAKSSDGSFGLFRGDCSTPAVVDGTVPATVKPSILGTLLLPAAGLLSPAVGDLIALGGVPLLPAAVASILGNGSFRSPRADKEPD